MLCVCVRDVEDEEENVKKFETEHTQVEKTKYCYLWYWVIVSLFCIGVITMSVLTILRYVHSRSHESHHQYIQIVPRYANAVHVSMKFFDVQKSGKLSDDKIAWRGDSGLLDGSEEGLDLSKGFYDAGDSMKFGFPMAFTATVLSWTILEYGGHLKAIQELENAYDSLKWVTDYFIQAHPSPNVLYVQVGNADLDHSCWERPEKMTGNRPLVQINTSFPGSDVAAETAAAMASASLVFKNINSTYSAILLTHAQQLFTFADTYTGLYSISLPQVQKYYNSTTYGDELLWAASWLYFATGDRMYLRYVTEINGQGFADWGNPTWFSWDDKRAGVHVLLSRINMISNVDISESDNLDLQKYRKTAEAIMCGLIPDSPTASPNRTEGGLIWVAEWNCLQHSMASAFLALLYSDYMLTSNTEFLDCSGKFYKPNDLRNFSISQVEYVMGNNPMKMSYIVGYGSNYPLHIHHRGSSIPVDSGTGCKDGFKWLYSDSPNPNVAVGALVGGPSYNESYVDNRSNIMQGESTTYNSALLVGLLSGLSSSSSRVTKSFT